MNLGSPVVAMLWENWRVSRVEVAQRLVLGLVLGTGAFALPTGARAAFWILITLHSMIWFSIAKLNGGRFADGYKPGFPFHLQFARPVATSMMVGVAMAYDALTCTALYLVSAALLSLAFGQPLPMFSVALCLVVYHLAYACVQWSTRNRIVQWLGSIAFSLPLVILLLNRITASLRVELSLVDNLVLVLVGAVCVWLTIAGVARQRRGDSVAVEPRLKAGSGGYPDWMVNLFRLPVPTSSRMRAQVWFELRSSGLPALTIGLLVALVICLFYALGIAFAAFRHPAIAVTFLAAPVMLFALGGNAFGIRRKQGRMYGSSFELTQPYGTAQLAAIKLLVRTTCVLLPLIAVGASIWFSSAFLGAWGEWLGDSKTDTLPKLLAARQTIADAFAGQPPAAHAAQAMLACIAVAGVVAWQAARDALKVRYRRQVLVAQWLPAAWGLAILLLGNAGKFGFLPDAIARAGVMTAMVIATAGLAALSGYLVWHSLRERALSAGYAGGALVILVVFAVAYRVLLQAVGEPHAGIHWTAVLLMTWPVLLLLLGGAIAPWALHRARHT